MIAILDYITYVFGYIVDLLNIKPFSDFNVSILQIILCGFVLKFIFNFIFGGMKEIDISTNWVNSAVVNSGINNYKRKKALSVEQARIQKIHDKYTGGNIKINKATKQEQEEMRAMLRGL